MIDNIFLKLIALFNPVFESAGIDSFQLNLILRTKLLIDQRRPTAMFVGRGRAKANTTTGTSGAAIFVTLIMGAVYGILLFVFQNPLMGQALYFGVFMVLMSLTLITDFTNVLIDVRDQYIILPRPVNDRTVAMARILHIGVYVMRLALLQGIPGMIMIGFIDGPLAVPLFLFQVVEATLFSIFMVNIIYLFLMRSVSPQRIKDVISYFQIAFSIIIFAIYRLPRFFNYLALREVDLLSHHWTYFLPSVWIAALNESLIHRSRSTFAIDVLALVSVVVPLVSIWIVAVVLAPGLIVRWLSWPFLTVLRHPKHRPP